MENLNPTQLKILSALLFRPKARFKDLNIESLGTDVFSYHIRTLVDSGLIQKDLSLYYLTPKGKLVAGGIDTSTQTLEKQPKIGVLLIPYKKVGGQKKYLVQKRLKEPFFGYHGFIAGKIRIGETVDQTAKRELMEEAGISGTPEHSFVLHELVYNKITRELLDDKFLHVVIITNLKGDLLEQTKEGSNKFIELKEFKDLNPKFWDLDKLLKWSANKSVKFKEFKHFVESV